ncbi:ATP-grasp fold amidoligase family protein [Vibrio breoganii]
MDIKSFIKERILFQKIFPAIRFQYYKAFITIAKIKILLFGHKKFVISHFNKNHPYKLSLDNPVGFAEKLAWTKIYSNNDLMTICADKYLVRKHVEKKIGSEYLIPLLGVYDSVKEIDFTNLESPYVLKVNHSSGGNFFDLPGKPINKSKSLKEIDHHMGLNAYYFGGELAYKNIEPKIIAEKVLFDESGNLPNDYKFFCFNGKPHFVQVDISRFSDHKRDFYDLNWNLLPFTLNYENADTRVNKPKMLEQMVYIAEKLAKDFDFARVDLYVIADRIYFGEITFYPESASMDFKPFSYEEKIGSKLRLS